MVEVEKTQSQNISSAWNVLKRTSGINSVLHQPIPDHFNLFSYDDEANESKDVIQEKPTNMQEGMSKGGGLRSKTTATIMLTS